MTEKPPYAPTHGGYICPRCNQYTLVRWLHDAWHAAQDAAGNAPTPESQS